MIAIRQPGRYGRKPNDPSKPRVRFAEFSRVPVPGSGDLVRAFRSPPTHLDWYSKVTNWPMYLNDQLGDCTCAEVGHQIESAAAYVGTWVEVSDSDVLAFYELFGYVPGDPSTDQGAVIQDVLGAWRKAGIGDHRCLAFAEVDITNLAEVKKAAALFSSLDLGITVTQGDENAFALGQPWSTAYPAGQVAGGHSVELVGYDPFGGWVVTWGALQRFTWAWWKRAVVEAWLVVMPEWLNASDEAPSGCNLHRLGVLMQAMTGEPMPVELLHGVRG